MHKQLIVVVALVLAGCQKKPMPQPAANSDPKQPPRAELRVGGDDQDEVRHLSFKIIGVHEKCKPSDAAPFYVAEGDWTFLDCEAKVDPTVAFSVGLLSKERCGNARAAWGKVTLIVTDGEAGARFVELFSKSFGGALPVAAKRAYIPGPLSVNTAILGWNMKREKLGGFSGEAGGWTATKWFPEYDGDSGEVYFNYDLSSREGEFSEKDAEYADPLVAIFASALRDRPRPERTPENDPNLIGIGPKFGQPRKLLAQRVSHYSFSPNSAFAVFQNDAAIFAVTTSQPNDRPRELVRFDHSPWTVHVVDDGLNLVVQEGTPEEPGVKSSADPMRIWWVDGKTKEKKLLRGPEKGLNLVEFPVSPDHRYVVLSQWQDDPRNDGRNDVVYFLDRESGRSCSCVSKHGLSVVGWKNTKAGLRLVGVTNRWRFDKVEPSEMYLVDPATGIMERQENVDARLDIDDRLSPDGLHRIRVGKEDLIVTDVANGKRHRFVFHEDDRRFVGPECVDWASPRYLKFNGQRLSLIDVTTMKMSFPAPANAPKVGSHVYRFSSDFRWVMFQGEWTDGDGLFLAPIETPREP